MYIYTLVTSIYKNNTKIAMQSCKEVLLAYLSHFHKDTVCYTNERHDFATSPNIILYMYMYLKLH